MNNNTFTARPSENGGNENAAFLLSFYAEYTKWNDFGVM